MAHVCIVASVTSEWLRAGSSVARRVVWPGTDWKAGSMRDKVSGARRWVVKIGSALLTADGRGLDQAAMAVWVDQMVALRKAGVELVLVSSGAVAAGMSRLGWAARPKAVHELQAAAAVGQMGLIRAWEASFARCEQQTAQVLVPMMISPIVSAISMLAVRFVR